MNCDEVREIIQLYLDDELEGRDTLNVQRHLEACSACSHLLDSFLEQDRMLKEQARVENVESNKVRERILNAIRVEFSQSRRRWNVLASWRYGGPWRRIAAIAVLSTVAGVLLLRSGPPQVPGQSVYAAVVSDHADHCSADSPVGAIRNGDELDHLSAVYGKLRRTPNLLAFGYRDPAGRTCKVNGTVFLHLVYYCSDQPPISMFLRPHSPGLAADSLIMLHKAQYMVTSLSKSGVDLLVVTPVGYEQGSEIAQTIASQL